MDISEKPMKEEDIDTKRQIITYELAQNNLMEFKRQINRNTELDRALITQPPKESDDITPRCSLDYSDLKDKSHECMRNNNVKAFQK